MYSLGVRYVSAADLLATFDTFDHDGSGFIDYRELDKTLLSLPRERPREPRSPEPRTPPPHVPLPYDLQLFPSPPAQDEAMREPPMAHGWGAGVPASVPWTRLAERDAALSWWETRKPPPAWRKDEPPPALPCLLPPGLAIPGVAPAAHAAQMPSALAAVASSTAQLPPPSSQQQHFHNYPPLVKSLDAEADRWTSTLAKHAIGGAAAPPRPSALLSWGTPSHARARLEVEGKTGGAAALREPVPPASTHAGYPRSAFRHTFAPGVGTNGGGGYASGSCRGGVNGFGGGPMQLRNSASMGSGLDHYARVRAEPTRRERMLQERAAGFGRGTGGAVDTSPTKAWAALARSS